MYPAEIVKPMREELTNIGFEELTTSDDVSNALTKKGTTLIVVNSICGCAAANVPTSSLRRLAFFLRSWTVQDWNNCAID